MSPPPDRPSDAAGHAARRVRDRRVRSGINGAREIVVGVLLLVVLVAPVVELGPAPQVRPTTTDPTGTDPTGTDGPRWFTVDTAADTTAEHGTGDVEDHRVTEACRTGRETARQQRSFRGTPAATTHVPPRCRVHED
ncbi:MAG: hypothetical protein ABS81_07680 [Pseudonocardia sp. SCN 72-86]|nr:MAG: hypothetical protein ABS81_07680 [Pseudonocardia sp. SCN 72-86]